MPTSSASSRWAAASIDSPSCTPPVGISQVTSAGDVPELLDEQDVVVVDEREHPDARAEADDPVQRRRPRRKLDDVLVDGDPRVLVDPARLSRRHVG